MFTGGVNARNNQNRKTERVMSHDHVEVLHSIARELGRVIKGKAEVLELLLVGILSQGHVLLEDVPGVGKTTVAKAISSVFEMDFARVQFTPDLLPTDILGAQIFHPGDGTFEFQPGPIFANVLLADEVNRASPRTQSALLEAMNERQVTIEGLTRALPTPFLVLATQNPVDFRGTYPLPEAQLDRFMLRLSLGYPDEENELEMLFSRRTVDPLESLKPLTTAAQLLQIQSAVRDVQIEKDVGRYLLRIVRETRDRREVKLGVSPRGSLSFFRAVQAHAYLKGRLFVTPDDVQQMAPHVLAHRVVLSQQGAYGGGSAADVVREIVEGLEVPT